MYFMDLINTKSKGLLAKLFIYLKRESLSNLLECAHELWEEELFIPRINETTLQQLESFSSCADMPIDDIEKFLLAQQVKDVDAPRATGDDIDEELRQLLEERVDEKWKYYRTIREWYPAIAELTPVMTFLGSQFNAEDNQLLLSYQTGMIVNRQAPYSKHAEDAATKLGLDLAEEFCADCETQYLFKNYTVSFDCGPVFWQKLVKRPIEVSVVVENGSSSEDTVSELDGNLKERLHKNFFGPGYPLKAKHGHGQGDVETTKDRFLHKGINNCFYSFNCHTCSQLFPVCLGAILKCCGYLICPKCVPPAIHCAQDKFDRHGNPIPPRCYRCRAPFNGPADFSRSHLQIDHRDIDFWLLHSEVPSRQLMEFRLREGYEGLHPSALNTPRMVLTPPGLPMSLNKFLTQHVQKNYEPSKVRKIQNRETAKLFEDHSLFVTHFPKGKVTDLWQFIATDESPE